MNDAYKNSLVITLMAKYFLNSQDAQCLLCDNYMKNIKIIRQNGDVFGCDGNCQWNKEYTKDDLIELFEKEADKMIQSFTNGMIESLNK